MAAQRSLGQRSWTWQSLSQCECSTPMLTFSFICILWSFWTSGSMSAWLSMWARRRREFACSSSDPPSLLLSAALGSTVAQGAGGKDGSPVRVRRWPRWLDKRILTAGSLALLLLAGVEDVHSKIGRRILDNRHEPAELAAEPTGRGAARARVLRRPSIGSVQLTALGHLRKKPVHWLSVEGRWP